MGVTNLWADVPFKTQRLWEWAHEWKKTHSSYPRIAIDMSQMLYQIEHNQWSQGRGIEHRNLARRLLGFLVVGIIPMCVFDGDLTQAKRRGTSAGQRNWAWAGYARQLCRALGIAVIEAPGEAEAECWRLEADGYCDALFTNDADVLCHGAKLILRYSTASHASDDGSRSWERFVDVLEVKQPRYVYAMRALLSGNDWHAGVERVGPDTARRLADPGDALYSKTLGEICERYPENPAESAAMSAWRHDIQLELQQNTSELLSRKTPQAQMPTDWPPAEAVAALLHPRVGKTAPPISAPILYTDIYSLWMRRSPVRRTLQAPAAKSKRTQSPTEKQLATVLTPALLLEQIRASKDTTVAAQWIQQATNKLGMVTVSLAQDVPVPKELRKLTDSIILPLQILLDAAPSLISKVDTWTSKTSQRDGVRRETRSPQPAANDGLITSFFGVAKRKETSSSSTLKLATPSKRERVNPGRGHPPPSSPPSSDSDVSVTKVLILP